MRTRIVFECPFGNVFRVRQQAGSDIGAPHLHLFVDPVGILSCYGSRFVVIVIILGRYAAGNDVGHIIMLYAFGGHRKGLLKNDRVKIRRVRIAAKAEIAQTVRWAQTNISTMNPA